MFVEKEMKESGGAEAPLLTAKLAVGSGKQVPVADSAMPVSFFVAGVPTSFFEMPARLKTRPNTNFASSLSNRGVGYGEFWILALVFVTDNGSPDFAARSVMSMLGAARGGCERRYEKSPFGEMPVGGKTGSERAECQSLA